MPTTKPLLYHDRWYYFEGRKYWHQDIDLLADMRRKGIVGGTLAGAELEDFVKRCLMTTDYQVLGLPCEPHPHAVAALQ